MLAASYRSVDDSQERRRLGALCLAVIIFDIIVVHNVLTRNWTPWFGSAPPWLFFETASVGEDILFLFVPLMLTYAVLTEGRRGADRHGRRSTLPYSAHQQALSRMYRMVVTQAQRSPTWRSTGCWP